MTSVIYDSAKQSTNWPLLIVRTLLFALLLASPAFLATEAGAADVPVVTGTVTNAETGEPIGGIHLTLMRLNALTGYWDWIDNVLSNANGTYQLMAPLAPPGTYRVSASRSDFVYFASEQFVFDGTNPHVVDISLVPMVPAVSGIVTNSVTGDPIGGAELTLMRLDPARGDWVQADFVVRVSNANGTYQLMAPASPPGTYRVHGPHHNFVPFTSEPFVFDGTNPHVINISLTPMVPVVSGLVTNAVTGEPMADVRLGLTRLHAATGEWQWIASQGGFNTNGTYQLMVPSTSPGTYRVWAFAWDFVDFASEQFVFDGTNPHVIDISMLPNTAPVAVADSYTTPHNTTLTVPAPGVLANDTDAEATTLTASVVSAPTTGTLNLSGNGAFTFLPPRGFSGTVAFTYRAFDGAAHSAPATVTIRVQAPALPPDPSPAPVNTAPVAVADSYTTAHATTLTVFAPGVLANDTDAEGNALIASMVSPPAAGTLSILGDGSFAYVPPSGFSGTVTFAYRAFDGVVHSAPVMVTITVSPAPNTAPVAVADAYTTAHATTLTVPAPGVLSNDTDPEGGALTASLVSAPAAGTLGLLGNGSFTFVPPSGFSGTVAFTYRANDGTLTSGPATVTITVQPAPEPPAPVIPVEGATRFDTAVSASEEAFPDGLDPEGARTVVIATGRNWPDALGGTALAGALDGPVLLVDTNAVPAAVTAEITRLEADRAIIIGGTGALGSAVESALKIALGDADVTRIAGVNRFETADRVAAEVRQVLGTGWDGHAFVATGDNFPDALAAAPLAAAQGWPLYLADPETGLSAATVSAMQGVTDVVILGGTGAVSQATENGLVDRLGRDDVVRLQGANRYATAVAIATHAVSLGHTWNMVGITTGENFPDALAGGILQGERNSVMLLTTPNTLHTAPEAALTANAAAIDTVTFFGGTGAVSQAVRDSVQNIVAN